MRPTDEQLIDSATKAILEERRAGVQKWFYLSYAKPAEEGGFRGGLYTFAYGFVEAVTRARIIGLDPGGEVHGVECPIAHLPPPEYRERLLTKAELEAATGSEFLTLHEISKRIEEEN